MRISFTLIFFFILTSCQKELSKSIALKQTDDEIICPINLVEQPQFPGGISAMLKFVSENVKFTENKGQICSKAFVSFFVLENGQLENVEIIKGFEDCTNMKLELIEAFKKMPSWKAGKIDGKVSKIKFTVPITFEFEN